MNVKATLCKGRDLQPGDLFSVYGQDYWSTIDARLSVGESVYIRTSTPPDLYPDPDLEIYRIEIIRDNPAPHAYPDRIIEALRDVYAFASVMVDKHGMNGDDTMTDAQHRVWQRVAGAAVVVLQKAGPGIVASWGYCEDCSAELAEAGACPEGCTP